MEKVALTAVVASRQFLVSVASRLIELVACSLSASAGDVGYIDWLELEFQNPY
jgi:hypothetical protein